jgi:membrane protease YdiL (CAAX protease family)
MVAQRWPLVTFYGLAFACTWALLPMAGRSIPVALIALCGPAAAALMTAGLLGPPQLADLRRRTLQWRVSIRWYAVALLLPPLVSGLRTVFEQLSGVSGPVDLQPITPLALVVFVLVLGEEIGWRGFALPRLLARWDPWTASVITGVVWALWHFPLFHMPSMPQYGSAFVPYVGYLIGLSIILTLLVERTQGSVLIATLFHGAVNTFGFVSPAANAIERSWSNALAYLVVALALGALAWNRFRPWPLRHAPRARAPRHRA